MSQSVWWKEGIRVITVLVALIVVASVVATTYMLVTPSVKPIIATIQVNYYIESSAVRDYVMNMVDLAVRNDTIKAVVVQVDSPGGWANAVEEIYLGLLKLRSKKPVVVSVVGFALSGGYYIAVSADYIYAVPTSFVGNVGVLGIMPAKAPPSEQMVETGPYKISGFSEMGFMYTLQEALGNFVDAIASQRGNKLLLNKTTLSTGAIYLGSEAARNGMIDEVGSTEHAIEKAAELARVTQYNVALLNQLVPAPKDLITVSHNASSPNKMSFRLLKDLRPAPSFYYIYLSPALGNLPETAIMSTWEHQDVTPITPLASPYGKKMVLVDQSHANAFGSDEFAMLMTEIVFRESVPRYVSNSMDLITGLKDAVSLIVISPTSGFSYEELAAINDFLNRGGRLLMIIDPTRTYASYINSLSQEFGITFGNGYLYNPKRYDGIYRNIYVTHFEDSTVTQGLKEIALYTASPIYSTKGKVALTDNSTYSSEAERPGPYSVIVYNSQDNILAIGDQTFLNEPYCYVQDNYQLLTNIATFLAG